ncbi:SAM-dependent MidA family methyltransferase [Streptacidiphilus sp. MAP12-20]|uniref:SAM-dependent methyltransferase n=1 Tax=Streptacidiphilus sp. MAP12-20 TaxID=3156299 RepID=UPI0035167E32
MGYLRWRQAMERALYGPDGFFVRAGAGPAGHFRTSVHASPLFAGAVLRLVQWVDEGLGRPDELVVCDVGAGRGELLVALGAQARRQDPGLANRLTLRAVERAERPESLPGWVEWTDRIAPIDAGLLFANEWLDNVPCEVMGLDEEGVARYVLVDPLTGDEQLGGVLSDEDGRWLETQFKPLPERAELGLPRDRAWAEAVSTLGRGLAVAVDYAHTRATRPPYGTLTGYRAGQQVAPVPDGSCDLTAHVALDACLDAAATTNPRVTHSLWTTQREALRALGVSGERPPLALASSDPVGYVRALAAAGEAAELTALGGLGSFLWGAQAVDMGLPAGWQTLSP